MPAGTSLVCSSCRAPLRPGDVTCANCGAPVTGVGTPAPGEPPVSYPEGFAFSWEAVEERLAEITIGEYRILTELGRGGMAAVFLAHEYALNRKVALKVMSPAIMLTEGMVERFRAEAVMQANLTHPNIVGVHAVRQDEELQYFVMQYVPGRSLQQVLRGELAAGRMLSLGVIRSLVQQIGSALAYAHRRGVIHRDIKPGNVLLNADGDAVVTDFGIAKVTSSPTQTLTGMVVGTVPYMSPEQCYGAELTGASDQYSLGILTYELLTGATPFSGNSFMVMQAHTLEPPPPIIPRRPDCPPEFEAAVMKMLAKRHEDRFPDINAALVALEARPAPSSISDPLRTELITLADVASVEATFSGVLQVPFSPAPPSRAVRRPSMRGPRVADDVAAGGGAPEQQGDGSPVMALRLQDPPSRIEAGQRIRLGVAAFDANGTSLPDVTMRWSSSNPGIARVAADTGEIEALHPGSADIVVSAGHAVATARLVVAEAAIANIMGTNVPVAIEMGDAVTLAAEALDARGTPLARAVTWSLRKGSPAEISADGRLTALDEGIATLVATAGSVSAEFQVTIRPPAAAGIEVSDLPGVIAPGEQLRASVTLLDRRGRILRGRTVSWHSSAANVLAVSVDGEVTGVAPGEADIEVRCDDASHSAHVAVGLVTIASIDVGSLPSHMRAGSRRRLSAVATDSSGRERSTIPAQWSSSNPEVLAVDETGTAVAMAPGTASLSVRCGSLERAFPVHVAPPVSLPALLKRAWSVVPTRAALGIIGALAVVAVAVRFVPGWLHSSPAGTVSTAGTPAPPETTGQPIPASPATGDASLRFPSTLPRDAIVLVNGARVADAGQPVSLPPGRATIDITAAGFQPYHGEVTLEAGKEVTWQGTLVRATPDARPGREPFATPPPNAAVTAVTILSAPRTLTVGDSSLLRARALPTGSGSGPPIQWSIRGDATAAAIDRLGYLKAIRAGTITVIASAGDKEAESTVTIASRVAEVQPESVVARLEISGGATTLYPDSETVLGVDVFSRANSRMSSSGVSWRALTSNLVVEASTGRVHARSPGLGQVVAELNGVVSPPHTITVEPRPIVTAARPPDAGTQVGPRGSSGQLLPTAAEIETAARECAGAFAAMDETRLRRLATGGTRAEDTWLNDLLSLQGKQLEVRVGKTTVPGASGDQTSFRLGLQFSYKENPRFSPQRTEAQASVDGRLVRGSAGWELTSCRLQSSPKSR